MNNFYRFSLVAVMSLAFASPELFAQETDEDVEEVVVTGTRSLILTLLAHLKSRWLLLMILKIGEQLG